MNCTKLDLLMGNCLPEKELDEGLQCDLLSERTLSVLMFLYFLQGEHRQISPSGDLEEEQGTKDIAALHPGQDIELFRRFI